MHQNMVNDLAEAMKALDGKKVHFVFTCPSNTSEFEASAWLYNLLHDKVQHIGFMQNLGVTFCANNN